MNWPMDFSRRGTTRTLSGGIEHGPPHLSTYCGRNPRMILGVGKLDPSNINSNQRLKKVPWLDQPPLQVNAA